MVHITLKSGIVNLPKNIPRRSNVNQKDNTSQNSKAQDMVSLWTEKIETLLPADLEESAKTKGALKRKRGLKSASDLIKLLLIYAVSTMSMRMLSLCAASLKIADVTDVALAKRFRKSEGWLAYILDYLLPKPKVVFGNYGVTQTVTKSIRRSVNLIDGSMVTEAGKGGNSYRIHMSYNLSIGSMSDVQVTDKHTAESFAHCNIQKNDIYIADSGYGKAKMYDYIISRCADAILRFTPNHVTLVNNRGEVIDMAQKLDTKEKTIEFRCYAKHGKKLLPVRIIASQLPEDKKPGAIKRKKKEAQKYQTKNMRPETLLYAEWTIIMTSLDESYTAEDVLTIYRSRWQVELLFKRIKQHFKVTKIRPSTQKYGKVLVLLWLIIWALVERQAYMAEIYMIEKGLDMSRHYPWALSSFIFQRIKMTIESLWATLLDIEADIEIVAEKLQNHKQDRVNQYFQFHLNNFLEMAACRPRNIAA